MPWKQAPISIDVWNTSHADNFIFVDERGTSDTKYIKKMIANQHEIDSLDENSRYLTLCACIIHKDYFVNISEESRKIKIKHWPPDGHHDYKQWRKKKNNFEITNKTVVFHSTEIKSKMGPFYPKLINYEDFRKDLNEFLINSNYTIIAVTIDKYELLSTACFHQNTDPYHVAYEFLLERISYMLNEKSETGAIMNEFRGDKENKSLLNFINNLIHDGNLFLQKDKFKNIKGVYFNSKRDVSDLKSFFGLEIVDMILPSISRFVIHSSEDKLFLEIKHKIRNYPDFMGEGLEFYPNKT